MPVKKNNVVVDEKNETVNKSISNKGDASKIEIPTDDTLDTPTFSEPEELNLEKKVTVKSIAGWATGFRRMDSSGDVTIPPEGSIRLARGEIIAQVQNGNTLFTGTDGMGSHASLYIEDKPTRVEVDFESEDGYQNQMLLTSDAVKELFNTNSVKAFKDKLEKLVVTRAEKYSIIQTIKKLKINDFEKVRIVEKYTGFSIY